jgi:succinate-acetate transporter protein
MKKKTKVIIGIITFLIFIFSVYTAFHFEDSFRKMIRELFEYFSNHRISHIPPRTDFHISSGPFVISFGAFTSLMFLLLFRQTSKQKIVNCSLGLLFFVFSIGFYCGLDSHLKLVTCTSFENGILSMHWNDINYNALFILGLLFAALPAMIPEVKRLADKK